MPPAVNFSGNWLLDVKGSDSLDPLVAYHGVAVTPVAALSVSARPDGTLISNMHSQSTSFTSASVTNGSMLDNSAPHIASTLTVVNETDESRSRATSEAVSPVSQPGGVAVESVPALIVQHSSRRLITYLHALIPRYDENGKLTRYDPLDQATRLAVHEEYKLDGEYHTVKTARGQVQARAYVAPHGQSVIVDTRCTSKYDLERVERFLERDGKQLVLEVRILSCAPEHQQSTSISSKGVSSKFSQNSSTTSVQQGQVVVKEILFLRRVFNRILDADPNAAATAAAAQEANNRASSSGVHLPAFGSGSNGSIAEEENLGGMINFNAAENHHSPVKTRMPIQSAVAVTSLPTIGAAILPKSMLQPGTKDTRSMWQKLQDDVLYPRSSMLAEYDLTALVVPVSGNVPPQVKSEMDELAAKDRESYAKAKSAMYKLDMAILIIVFLFIAYQLGFFGSWGGGEAAADLVSEGVKVVQDTAVEISKIAVTLTPPPPPEIAKDL